MVRRISLRRENRQSHRQHPNAQGRCFYSGEAGTYSEGSCSPRRKETCRKGRQSIRVREKAVRAGASGSLRFVLHPAREIRIRFRIHARGDDPSGQTEDFGTRREGQKPGPGHTVSRQPFRNLQSFGRKTARMVRDAFSGTCGHSEGT